MMKRIRNFRISEDGAVTVDWVVLTAAVVALAGAVLLSIKGSSDNVGEGTGSYLQDVTAGDV
ncbi:hypothetical protein OS190_16435 [Sulfitobacter sp. F26204]|uniref:hypothetical protein n=1 Tax=Sulfitobacter sp. F26204 TaxID=2996014 RepID=UPI00225E4E4B|nr:hypothetical protein [Sulfitobacter sp. F26204]MCX7561158.1 hypothetical protein [Sulfitobacter sp. F26204]